MDTKMIRATRIYNEFSEEKAREWFSYTRSKFISHVDTFYYSVKTIGDWSLNLGSCALIGTLKVLKEQAEKEGEAQPFMEDDVFSDLVVKPRFGFGMYRYGISKEDCFDIFVAESVPNLQTSTIVVQLRSEGIWLRGLQDAFYESLVYLYGILERYAIQIGDITENRIDFAYHTNYIQDMLSFFKEENLGQMQVSSFKRWSKEGSFLGDTMYNDYISLGRRKSNSAFVRIYNKSKEVVEMGYKQFFVPIWRQNGLISAFDQYVFDRIFERGKQSWNYKEVARCLFYLDYGQDDEIKLGIRQLLAFEDSDVKDYKKLADSCVPDLTDVVNIEVQTKRKFYYDFLFPKLEQPDWVPLCERRIHKIFHMLQSIRDFITHDTIRFVKFKGEHAKLRRERRPTADWWLRLSACGELGGISYDLCKEYQKRYDTQRSKSRSLTSIATLASLLEDWDTDDFSLSEDVADILCHLNDNDLKRYDTLRQKKRKEIRQYFGHGRADGRAPDITEGEEREDEDGEIANFFDRVCRA